MWCNLRNVCEFSNNLYIYIYIYLLVTVSIYSLFGFSSTRKMQLEKLRKNVNRDGRERKYLRWMLPRYRLL